MSNFMQNMSDYNLCLKICKRCFLEFGFIPEETLDKMLDICFAALKDYPDDGLRQRLIATNPMSQMVKKQINSATHDDFLQTAHLIQLHLEHKTFPHRLEFKW